eukprot:13423964-Alexandrium_andersonii.AAC.1
MVRKGRRRDAAAGNVMMPRTPSVGQSRGWEGEGRGGEQWGAGLSGRTEGPGDGPAQRRRPC